MTAPARPDPYQGFRLLPPDARTEPRIVYEIPETGFSEPDLIELLPRKPYCSDDLGKGLRIRTRRHALKHRHISVNNPWAVKVLLYDVDEGPLSAAQWLPLSLPPTWICSNTESGNAHLAYVLTFPVDRGNQRSADYLRAVHVAMRYVLGGDSGYSGLITHNPMRSDCWAVQWSGQTYSLGDLARPALELCPASILDRNQATARAAEGLQDVAEGGRNCALFEEVRAWAYLAIRKFRKRSMADFLAETMDVTEQMASCIPEQLPGSEVRSVALSVARWTWSQDPKAEAKFRKRQAWKGQRSGQVRRAGSKAEKQPWNALGISRATYFRRGLHLPG